MVDYTGVVRILREPSKTEREYQSTFRRANHVYYYASTFLPVTPVVSILNVQLKREWYNCWPLHLEEDFSSHICCIERGALISTDSWHHLSRRCPHDSFYCFWNYSRCCSVFTKWLFLSRLRNVELWISYEYYFVNHLWNNKWPNVLKPHWTNEYTTRQLWIEGEIIPMNNSNHFKMKMFLNDSGMRCEDWTSILSRFRLRT